MFNEYQFTYSGLRVMVHGRTGTIILSACGPNAPFRVGFDQPYNGCSALWVPPEYAEFTFLGEGI